MSYTEYSVSDKLIPEKCPWCGEKITGKNRLLTNDFGSYQMHFGCDKCITRPLEELTPPPDFKDPRNDPVVYAAIQSYRTEIAKAEWLAGRIDLLK